MILAQLQSKTLAVDFKSCPNITPPPVYCIGYCPYEYFLNEAERGQSFVFWGTVSILAKERYQTGVHIVLFNPVV